MKSILIIIFVFFLGSYIYAGEPDMYFCTACDKNYFRMVVNLIGSIHRVNFDETVQIAVFDLGLTDDQKKELVRIKKVELYQVECTHPDLLKPVKINHIKIVPGWYAWKPVIIKQALDMFPYVLYLDAGTTIMNPINNLFKHIIQNGYFFVDCGHDIKWMCTKYVIKKFNLESPGQQWILDKKTYGIAGGFQGLSQAVYQDYILPIYGLTRDLRNFVDDGTSVSGFGYARHDQTLFSIQARLLNLEISQEDYGDWRMTDLYIDEKKVPVHITGLKQHITEKTLIYHSRGYTNLEFYKQFIRYK